MKCISGKGASIFRNGSKDREKTWERGGGTKTIIEKYLWKGAFIFKNGLKSKDKMGES